MENLFLMQLLTKLCLNYGFLKKRRCEGSCAFSFCNGKNQGLHVANDQYIFPVNTDVLLILQTCEREFQHI